MHIHQFNPTLSSGDAISNHVAGLQTMLRAMGHRSDIFCEIPPASAPARSRSPDEYEAVSSPENIMLLHFSLHYSDRTLAWLAGLPDRKVLIYHNITPPRYFAGINNTYFEAAGRGYSQLAELSALTEAGWGDSGFNAQTLRRAGWQKTGVLPIAFDARNYAIPPAKKTEKLYPPGANVLFVGRVSPNKCFEDLIVAFYYLKKMRPDARLLLVGSTHKMTRYVDYLQTLVARLHVADVYFTGHVSRADLAAFYRVGDVFLSMSEHEGFGVPLLESMHYGLPVVAYHSTAVPETLGDSGVMFRQKKHRAVAALLDLLLADEPLRQQIVAGQRRRLQDFSVERVRIRLEQLLADLGVD